MKHALILALCLFAGTILQSNAQQKLPVIGLTTSYGNDSLAKASGFTCMEETVKKLLSPSLTEAEFNKQLPLIRNTRCKLESCNVFIPANIKIVGPEVNEAQVLGYVDTVMQRARIAGIRIIVLGSGGSRKMPEGIDREAAKQQFIQLARKMGVVAAKYDRTIAMENLNSTETNFINTLAEANEIVTAVNHPNFRLTADIYHMLKENEPAANIEKAKGNLVHCHIAEREKRTPPGVAGDDFRPYLAALKKIGYSGRIMMECRWTDPVTEYKPAVIYLQRQLREAYGVDPKK
ncbi:sugar phosphate isomerase/epimerase family protein [Chitinophaga sp. MM2321]|uniref:sugar phosphate isomerase/epimerase family protein n=1 Tax=Chitinophaga sp. MM2321 TaxID=3137178 RepID=UPI0032D59EC3